MSVISCLLSRGRGLRPVHGSQAVSQGTGHLSSAFYAGTWSSPLALSPDGPTSPESEYVVLSFSVLPDHFLTPFVMSTLTH